LAFAQYFSHLHPIACVRSFSRSQFIAPSLPFAHYQPIASFGISIFPHKLHEIRLHSSQSWSIKHRKASSLLHQVLHLDCNVSPESKTTHIENTYDGTPWAKDSSPSVATISQQPTASKPTTFHLCAQLSQVPRLSHLICNKAASSPSQAHIPQHAGTPARHLPPSLYQHQGRSPLLQLKLYTSSFLLHPLPRN
jgi:hypothetical protein